MMDRHGIGLFKNCRASRMNNICSANSLQSSYSFDAEKEEEPDDVQTIYPPKRYSSRELRCKPDQKAVPQSVIVHNQLERFDQKLIERTAKAVLNREHGFRSIWEKRNFMPIEPNTSSDPTVPYSTSQNWRQWPPQIPQLPDGLKIPMEFFSHVEYDLPHSGIPCKVDFGLEARPIAEAPEETFGNLNGLLNAPKAISFSVFPPSLLFVKPRIGVKHSALLKLRNDGDSPRRICVIRPVHMDFDVIWGAELNEKVLIPAGLTAKVWVVFKPRTKEPINDLLTVLVHGDGAIVVPLVVAAASPPILEMEEWDCGCSTLGRARMCQFEVKNLGGPARFWILTELDYMREYLSSPNERKKAEDEGEKDKANETNDLPTPMGELEKTPDKRIRMDFLHAKPFKIFPACFRLQKNQKIMVKASYRPTDANFHYEKLVVLCDNGEVRWIAIRGIGINQKKQKLAMLKGEWTGPPCDLPTDISAKLITDCGNLLAGEFANPQFKIVNDSCIPLYFFWSIRPILTTEGELATPLEGNRMQHFLEGTSVQEWRDCHSECTFQNQIPCPDESLNIFPAQGILDCREEIDCEIKVRCPTKLGYYACILSLFVQQVGNDAKEILTTLISDLTAQKLNNAPICSEQLVKHMPKEFEYESSESESELLAAAATTKRRKHRRKRRTTNSRLFLPTPIFHLQRGEPVQEFNNQCEFYLAKLKFGPRSSALNEATFIIDRRKTVKEVTDADAKNAAAEEINGVEGALVVAKIEEEPKKKKRGKKIRQPQNDDCVWACQQYGEGKWLTEDAAFLPDAEIEMWFKSVPLSCWINPPFLVATGYAVSELERKFEIHNQTNHPIKVSWEPIVSDTFSVVINPPSFTVSSQHVFIFQIIVHLHKGGNISEKIKGTLELPFKTIQASIPLNIQIFGPSLEVLTPMIDFGIIAHGEEKTMSFALKNSGSQRLTWRAKLTPELMSKSESPATDQTPDDLLHQNKMNKFIRLWPDWGVLEPDEMAGGQIFLSAQTHGKLTATIIFTTDENNLMETPLFIPIFAEIQTLSLVLKHGKLLVRDIFPSVPSDCLAVTLINPTGFLVPFAWQEAVGAQAEFCSIQLDPKFGVVLPKQSVTCSVRILAEKQVALNNLFIPCCVEGMKEPLLLQIEGQVSGLLVAFILPCTKPPQSFVQDDISASALNERWSYIYKKSLNPLADLEERKGEGYHGHHHGRGESAGVKWVKYPGCEEGEECPGESAGFTTTATSEHFTTEENEEEKEGKKGKGGKGKKKRKSTIFGEVEVTAGQSQVAQEEKGKKKGKKKAKGGKRKISAGTSLGTGDHDEESHADFNVLENKDQPHASVASVVQTKGSPTTKQRKTEDGVKTETVPTTQSTDFLKMEAGMEYSGENEFPGEDAMFPLPNLAYEESRSFYTPLMAGRDPSFMDRIDVQSNPYSPIPLDYAEGKRVIYFIPTPVGQMVQEIFTIQNHSPVRAGFVMRADKFNIDSWIDEGKSTIENLIARKMMSQSPADIEGKIMNGRSGVAFEILPREGFLEPYGILNVMIRVHSNLWGVFEDDLICQFEGVSDPYSIHLEANVTARRPVVLPPPRLRKDFAINSNLEE